MMFCPQCGQQQISGEVRFCSRCGFPLEVVNQLLGSGGMLAAYNADDFKISPRRQGVRQGAMLMLAGILLVPLLAVLSNYTLFPEAIVAMASIICFVGAFVRIVYALLFEPGASKRNDFLVPGYVPPSAPAIKSPASSVQALPPAHPGTSIPKQYFRPKNTGELAQPPSVTEGTTRLLNKETDSSKY